MALHKDLTSIHPAAFVGSSDPGAVGPNKEWLDTTNGVAAYVRKIRNAGNTAWDIVSDEYTKTEVNTALAGKVGTGDSRLSDARTPTAHAASHLAAGSDPLSGISPSQITGTAVVT